jgi:cholesterol transport system auxiliary component
MTDTRPNRRHAIAAGASFLALSACGSLLSSPSEPGKIYVLSPNLATAPAPSRTSWQLVVARPEASASLTTERIALLRGAEMDYYADAQWTDAVPQLLQNLLVEAIEKSGVAVARDVQGIKADYILQTEIRAFDARYDQADAPPRIEVDIMAKLIAQRTAAFVAAREFRREAQAAANSVPAAVAAFDQAVSAILADIAGWVLATPR